ncbi:MAG: hypothetical protein PHD41_00270 [Methanosarcinaceae archaeon]|nr:hypothetical protein [Methanosarcinaceae archaeon]MDD4330846.1 hypothetical protein [Methanosarcinaceae archaeon]MDD4748933.1 hypothetical protein [Methanosarcinaceae archaeon]
MDRFREPGQEEVELFLKSAGTHGSILDGDPLYRECALPGLQIQEAILFDFEEELEEPVRKPTKANP